MSPAPHSADPEFRAARDLLLAYCDDPDGACRAFRWPRPEYFNWALDWFDPIARGNEGTALHVTGGASDAVLSFSELAARSDQVAGWLGSLGVRRGDALLLLLDNRVELWETLLAVIKLGAVAVPTYTTATAEELTDRIERAGIRHVVAESRLTARLAAAPACLTRISAGPPVPGWHDHRDSHRYEAGFRPEGRTRGDDTLFYYFTSGTTSKPKMVRHTHLSYPVGHLSGMYWNGLRPGDLHLNISAPGWAKHTWSSFFVPWNAEAAVLALAPGAETPAGIMDALRRHPVTAFCAPPTVWRSLVAHGLPTAAPPLLREATSAGEPLDDATFQAVRQAWGIEIRDGYGQTETTAQIGHPPGRPVVPGRMGRPLPGYRPAVLDPRTGEPVPDGAIGELCVPLADEERPVGVMAGYHGEPDRTETAFAGDYYHTGDLVTRDADGYLTYVGRADDMFKSFDHRISPLELERALRRHPAVADAAVVPVPHPIGQWVPHAYLVPAADWAPGPATAEAVLAAAHALLPPEKHIHSVSFEKSLPKTASGKVRRAELRAADPYRTAPR